MNKGKRTLATSLLLLAFLLTGCPHNQYVVELTPRGKVIERKLVFYREDGVDTNGVPNYRSFPADELELVESCYPPNSIQKTGERRTAIGRFSSMTPDDVGGAGSYTSLTNSMGGAGFYVERFRGNDDFAGHMAKRTEKVDQLVDLVIGWSRKEFGHERHYRDLRKFLDEDFRQDMHNAGFYAWLIQASPTSTDELRLEFGIRLGQYLVERGYVKMEDLPGLSGATFDGDGRAVLLLLQRLIAEKLQVPVSQPMPKALVELADPTLAAKSWTNYLETTDLYHTRLKQWQKQKIKQDLSLANDRVYNYLTSRTNPPTPAPPVKPDPADVAWDLTKEMLDIGDLGGTEDHLAVKLSLGSMPTHTNGKWNETAKQVVWEADLEGRTNVMEMPAICYASWCDANEAFQTEHFGRVVLKGDDLLQYCMWREALNEKQSGEWETFVAGLKPGNELRGKLNGIQLSNQAGQNQNAADVPRKLINAALDGPAAGSGK